jgi:hypothetical protein
MKLLRFSYISDLPAAGMYTWGDLISECTGMYVWIADLPTPKGNEEAPPRKEKCPAILVDGIEHRN